MEDHLLPWKLFCWNVGPSLVHSSSVIQQMAAQLVKECHGHLRAIVLLARALKGETDIGVWEIALSQVLVKPKPNQTKPSQVMFHVLKFLWDRKDIITKRCIINCTDCREWRTIDSLVSSWIEYGLEEIEANGKVIVQELINSFLLENFDTGFVQMHKETPFVMRSFIPGHLRLGGSGLTETPEVQGCELLMELPLDIVALANLEHFDLEGTEIMYLPKEIGKLINLRSFKISFCQHANRYKETKEMDKTIPTGVLSKLNRLQELIIDVNQDDEWWDADVKVILKELSNLKLLSILELHLPSAELLQRLRRDLTKCFTYFRFTVGRHRQRIISRLPHEVEEIFKKKKEIDELS
ncbi:hypothetical protein LOK49_LG02G02711 [Camellia lanceoleosa]|uniref:Uncharacterized protein n=1 Tax=Camellia lanceoleosa TaxID=1840588 RepID=A0ACC0IJK1_9ERIC|nr:hypothetical protein LOK49_LG02G02711 [Camellia lanceoleosa]